ncbi:MAG: YeeE/YedE family protein [Hydrogenophilus sp.]
MEWTIHHTVLASALGTGVVVGAIANRTHFCTMGAVSDWVMMEDLSRLRSWFLAIAVALLLTLGLESARAVDLDGNLFPPYRNGNLQWVRHLLGGFLFGIGMTLASGCGNKTAVRVGGGNLKSLVVLMVIGLVAYWLIWHNGYAWLEPIASFAAITYPSQELSRLLFGADAAPLLHLVLGIALAAALLIFVLRDADFRRNRELIIAGVVIGAAVAFLWWVTGGAPGAAWREYAEFADVTPSRVNTQSLTFIAPTGDLIHYLTAPTETHRLNVGVMALLGVIIGSFLYALASGTFRIEWFADWSDFRYHLAGGILMGIGGVMGMGCTFGQGISGVSTLALGSLLTLVAIIAGSFATLKYLYWKMMREEA